MRKAERPEVIAAELRANVLKPARVTRARRWGMFASYAGLPILVILFFLSTFFVIASIPRFLNPDRVALYDALGMYDDCIAGCGIHTNSGSAQEKKAIETYISGKFGERVKDPLFWNNDYLIGLPVGGAELAKEIVARTPLPSPAELEKAMALIQPELTARSNLEMREELKVGIEACMFLLWWTVLFAALASLFCGLAFRGGLWWRVFGLVPVTANGQPASRWRFALRQLVAWSPLLAALVWGNPFTSGPLIGTAAGYAIGSVLALLTLGVVWVSTFYSKRSWPDRLAGTWLVIR